MKCEYELDGKILLVPIQGTGPSTILLKNVKVKGVFPYEEFKKKDKTFVKFVSSSLTIDPELVSFNFENLFNGDKKLGDNVNQVLNDNWKEVFDDRQLSKSARKEPKWKECVFEAATDGWSQLTKPFPELNLPNVAPLLIPEIHIEGSGRVAVSQHFKNTKIFGLSTINANKFEFDFDKKTLTIEGTFPELRMPGEYKLEGRVLLLPIHGEGTGLVTMKNVHVTNVLTYEDVKKKGKTYMKFVSSTVKVTPSEMYFKLDNLFNGDKSLGDNINQVLNENWEAVFEDLEGAYTELVNKITLNVLNGFTSKDEPPHRGCRREGNPGLSSRQMPPWGLAVRDDPDSATHENGVGASLNDWECFRAPDFQKCNRRQSDLKECVLKSAQDGISQLTRAYDEVNIPNVHPLEVAELTIEAGSGPVAFDQKFKQCKLDGFHKMKLDQFEFDFEGKTLTVAGVVPKIMVECQYEFDGKILLLPIKGKGPSTIVLENMKVSGLFDYEEKMKKGKTFIRFVSSDIHVDPELAWFNFENLFNGDKQLGDNVNQVINDNWKEVFDDLKSSYIQVINRWKKEESVVDGQLQCEAPGARSCGLILPRITGTPSPLSEEVTPQPRTEGRIFVSGFPVG
ncbi:hypothetical protein GEV33_001721 [Tenebrio molitor]|uniref:Uncharacterized protein n=1 Tax=Tenebrio molitor TaxID=7067 RepID=A0A8J6HUN5_TENMO|nr:hypothetical protein GEV33_001721 [Tenebrio molitor]